VIGNTRAAVTLSAAGFVGAIAFSEILLVILAFHHNFLSGF
jgi:hypothetical protein